MTKQQKTYFLLIVVLLIWGVIGYQTFSKLNTDQENTATVEMPKKYIPKKIKKDKPYTIKADYRDPFLGKTKNRKKNKSVNKSLNKKPAIPFPEVIYNGIVAGSTKAYTITINGKQELLKIGETFQDIKLVKANSEKITVRNNGITKTIQLR